MIAEVGGVPMGILVILLFTASALAQTAQPVSTDERLRYYVHRTYGWERIALMGADTVLDQVLKEPREWGREPQDFAYRYSSRFGRRIVRNSIELGAGILFHEDTRLKPSGRRGFWERLRYAATNTYLAPGGDGERTFSYARLASTAGGIFIPSAWQPCERTPGRYAMRFGNAYFGHLQNSILTEFSPDLLQFGRKVRMKIFRR